MGLGMAKILENSVLKKLASLSKQYDADQALAILMALDDESIDSFGDDSSLEESADDS